MVTRLEQMSKYTEICAEDGKGMLQLTKMNAYFGNGTPEKLRTFAFAELDPGASVGFHEHHGESESYYIISGEGTYDDNGTKVQVKAGDVTFTPSGEGHGIENTGAEMLQFIALIIVD